ncbi:glycosyltransferase family 1 protein [Infundibulicybe gibba]|nr:glycosyltransferase family 1 protein [Infundibulicybe gibba]
MLFAFLAFALVLFCARLYAVLPRRKPKVELRSGNLASSTCTLAIFLGSGGHTSEMLGLVSALDFSRYTPRIYIISEGDSLSEQKVVRLEMKTAPRRETYQILKIPRARRVHQSILSTPPTALTSLAACIFHIVINPIFRAEAFSDILLLNGPGTCFVLCIAVYVNKLFGLPAPKLVYIESFARVKSLSLSGRLLRRFVDRFVVQWPYPLQDGGPGECYHWLV